MRDSTQLKTEGNISIMAELFINIENQSISIDSIKRYYRKLRTSIDDKNQVLDSQLGTIIEFKNSNKDLFIPTPYQTLKNLITCASK